MQPVRNNSPKLLLLFVPTTTAAATNTFVNIPILVLEVPPVVFQGSDGQFTGPDDQRGELRWKAVFDRDPVHASNHASICAAVTVLS